MLCLSSQCSRGLTGELNGECLHPGQFYTCLDDFKVVHSELDHWAPKPRALLTPWCSSNHSPWVDVEQTHELASFPLSWLSAPLRWPGNRLPQHLELKVHISIPRALAEDRTALVSWLCTSRPCSGTMEAQPGRWRAHWTSWLRGLDT